MKKTFTLLEVLIATLTLAMAATIAVEMTARSQLGTFDAEDEWSTQHLLSLGCEYFLLFGHEVDFPQEKLPNDDFSLTCELNEGIIPEEEDEERYDPVNGWVIGEYTIILTREGVEVGSITVEKLVPAELFE